jgi:hypothetical protein
LVYAPTANTLRTFNKLAIGFFWIDLIFNLWGASTGSDLLNRTIDEREGVVGMRNGGVFGHSFYSGSISIGAIMGMLFNPQKTLLFLFPILNLILAGSYRLTIHALLIIILLLWRKRSRTAEWLFIAGGASVTVLLTIATSGILDIGLPVNDANTMRVIAWLTSISKISLSPISGTGYPALSGINYVTEELIDDSLITESWFLQTAITFGLPYMFLRFLALKNAYWLLRKTTLGKNIFPVIITDLVFGGFFEGAFFYPLLWLHISYYLRNDLEKSNS